MAISNNSTPRAGVPISDNSKRPQGISRPDKKNSVERTLQKSIQELVKSLNKNSTEAIEKWVKQATQELNLSASQRDKILSKYIKQNEEYKQRAENLKKQANDLRTELYDRFAKGQITSEELEEQLSNTEKLYKEAIDSQRDIIFEFTSDLDKVTDNIKDKFSDMGTKFADTMQETFKQNKKSFQGFLGPLNLLLSPITEMTGFDPFALLGEKLFGGKQGHGVLGKLLEIDKDINKEEKNKSLSEKVGGFLGIGGKTQKLKTKPNVNFVAKTNSGAMGALLLHQDLEKFIKQSRKKDVKEKGGKVLDTVMNTLGGVGGGIGGMEFGALLGKGGGVLTKGLTIGGGITAILSSIIMMIEDGVRGFFQADKWKTSKVSAVAGSVFGGAKKGIMNIFRQMGKWALMGAGIGIFAGPIGALVGGLIGAVLGGVLGAIGGERLAKVFDKMGLWFKDIFFPQVKNFIFKIFNIEKFIAIWKNSEDGVWAKIWNTIKEVFNVMIIKPIKGLWDFCVMMFDWAWQLITGIGRWFKDLFFKIPWDKIGKGISNAWNTTVNWVKDIGGIVINFVKNVFKGIGNFFVNVFLKGKQIVKIVKQVFKNAFRKVGDKISDIFSPITTFVKEKIIDPIKNFFKTIGRVFGFVTSLGARDIWDIITNKEVTFVERFEAYNAQKDVEEANVNDAIIRTDGSIIHTDPDDNIIATKNNPANISMIKNETQERLRRETSSLSNNNLEKKIDTLIDILGKILNKEPPKLVSPAQTRVDLDLIMSGGIL